MPQCQRRVLTLREQCFGANGNLFKQIFFVCKPRHFRRRLSIRFSKPAKFRHALGRIASWRDYDWLRGEFVAAALGVFRHFFSHNVCSLLGDIASQQSHYAKITTLTFRPLLRWLLVFLR